MYIVKSLVVLGLIILSHLVTLVESLAAHSVTNEEKLMKEDTLGEVVIDLVSPLITRGKYIEEYKKGGVTAVGVTLAANDGYAATMKTLEAWNNRIKDQNKGLIHVLKAHDIQVAYKLNKLGIIYHFQNSSPLDGNIDRVEECYKHGVRVMQLTYNAKNKFGCGAEVETDSGLTEEGRKLIERMNKIGMLIDVSHAGYKTAADIVAFSTKPVILSHSNALSLCDSARNVPDEIIKAVAQSGGVIGINAFSPLLTPGGKQATLDDFLDHIDYIVGLVGIDHVSLGLDYYTGQWPYVSDEEAIRNYEANIKSGAWQAKTYPKPPHKYAQGIETPDKIGNIKPALIKRGYSNQEIEKILGQNLVRVFSEVWK